MGASQRRKGHDWERQVARDLREHMPEAEIARSIQSRAGGAEGADVVCPGFHIECKRGRKPNPRAALAQAIEDEGGKGLFRVAVVKDDRQDAFVVMPYEDWLELMRLHWFLKGSAR